MVRLFNVSIPASLVLLVLCETALLSACYLGAGLMALNTNIDPWFYFLDENGWVQVLIAVLILQMGLYLLDLYDLKHYSRSYLLQQLCLLVGSSFMVQALVGYSESTLLQLPQWTMLFGSGLILVVIPLWRDLFFRLIRNRLPMQKLLFLNGTPAAGEISEYLKLRPEFGFNVIGYLGRADELPPVTAWLGEPAKLHEVWEQNKPDRVVVCRTENLPIHELLAMRMSGLLVEEAAALYEEVFGRVSLQLLDPHQLLFSKELRPRLWLLRLQTGYSFVGSLVGLILASPVMLVVAAAVKLTSKGPALYSQQRVGRNGKVFRIYKFRSMYIDAEARSGPVWASKNDPRVTPLGRWLRKLRLDELPQFFNVLQGDMALVGPRPERPEFCKVLEEKIPFYHQRHLVKPGITGWAQINHKYAESLEDTSVKLEYDLYYVKNLAPALDAYIIFHTLKVMLLFRGAQ